MIASNTTLLSIIAHARSGATEHAWRLFREAGLESARHDPAALSVLGRLLKDRAATATGAQRRKYYREAAAAYARAGAISAATYPLINAATLSLLAGDRNRARTLARQVLDQSARDNGEAETPYWREATRAEANLLLGDPARAQKDLATAVSLAPSAYEDHASTLRQFALILDELQQDKAWLDACRPPRSLHFAGHMALAPQNKAVGRDIRSFLERERVGFGYGALAAGADILIAEALLESGAELHLVLPSSEKHFREVSVAGAGSAWLKRFDKILRDATTVRSITQDCDPLSPLAIRLAAEISMGAAAMQANLLTTEALQLLILEAAAPRNRRAGVSDLMASTWRASERRQHIIVAPRIRAVTRRPPPSRRTNKHLAAMLRIVLPPDALRASSVLARLVRLLGSKPKPLQSAHWNGEDVSVAFDSVHQAARTALSAMALLSDVEGARVAGHYALVEKLPDPFGGTPLLHGPEAKLTSDILLSTPPGAVHVSGDFAAALYTGNQSDRPRTEFVGELPDNIETPVRLYSLRR